jgi:hypothetical protein
MDLGLFCVVGLLLSAAFRSRHFVHFGAGQTTTPKN